MSPSLRMGAHVVAVLVWLLLSAGAQEKGTSELSCGEGLSDCRMTKVSFRDAPPDPYGSLNITHVHLNASHCHSASCEPCLQIEISLQGADFEKQSPDGSGDDSDEEAIVKVCLSFPGSIEFCRAIHFKPAYMGESSKYKLRLTERVDFKAPVVVTADSKETQMVKNITFPSEKDVCPSKLFNDSQGRNVPRLHIYYTENLVWLQLKNIPSKQGKIYWEMEWDDISGQPLLWPTNKSEIVIPSYLIAPCLCFLAWFDGKDTKGKYCPFTNKTDALRRMQNNVSVTMAESPLRSGDTGLSWNATSPCKVQAEVQLCKKDMAGGQCEEVTGSKQQLNETGWKAVHRVHWQAGEFLLQPHPQLCVQVKSEGMVSFSKPQCPFETHRERWILLLLVGFILICLTILGVYLIQGVLKGYVWRWLKDVDVKGAVGGGHVMLLYPPDDDKRLPELLCHLGSSLQALGFTVSLDLWSQGELSVLGPVPWLHSRLDRLKRQGGKVVLVLTQTTWARAEEWGACSCENNEENITGVQGDSASSRHVDVFGASLSCILADYLQGRAGERFMLVQFESLPPAPPGGYRPLPRLFCGLHLYSLPSQSLGFLTELAGSKQIASASARRKRAGGLRMASRAFAKRLSGFTAGTNVLHLAGVSPGCVGREEEDSGEILLLEPNLITPPSSPDTAVGKMDWV
ncbi:interleukin-17 receptor C isoform X1 [Poecilia reticulata]|uniref:interleukin-17 receptor C isoform X1 n=1 Tax=Poecilia reticulata TaxID=8081 RepID=UPI0004A4B47A|nr:PREDICTED: interleukin-17 receptor C isoform X1 [Poecilia reticulata]